MPPRSPSHNDRYNAVVNLLLNQAEEDAKRASIMNRAGEISDLADFYALMELDDDMLKLCGWTRQELIIAKDAKLGKNNVPFYLHASHERHSSRLKAAQATVQPSGSTNAVAYVIPVQARPQLVEAEVVEDDDE